MFFLSDFACLVYACPLSSSTSSAVTVSHLKALLLQDNFEFIECPNRNAEPRHFLVVSGTQENIFLKRGGKLDAKIYTVDIVPRFVLKNSLSVPLYYAVRTRLHDFAHTIDYEEMELIEPGRSAHLKGKSLLVK